MKNKILKHFKGNFKSFYAEYLSEIKKVSGDEYASLCPFPNHNDTTPSFNFNNQNGRYKCYGCGKKGDIFCFYGEINDLDTRRDFRKILKGIANDFSIPWEERKSKPVITYDYTDADGNLLYQVCRMESKDFRQRRPNGDGNWIWNLKGVQRVLYRLPEVLKASEVLIVEGEKDVDNLSTLSLTATTSPMGANKWRPEYSEVLKGKNVVLIPDNDNEGREHMKQVAASLKGIAASLKWIDLPDLQSKGDVSDYIATFDDKEQASERLSILIDQAEPYNPSEIKTIDDVILTANQFCELNLPTRQELLKPWLKADSINLISGWRGRGKTWFTLGILNAVSRGISFGPWECTNHVPCLFLDGEMPYSDIKERLETLNINPEIYTYSDAVANQYGLPRAHLADETWRQTMKRILTDWKIKLWAIDNLASLASGLDENSKKEWDPINQWLLELRFAGIATLANHHLNKDGGQRGTSAREDNLDISILLKPPHDYTPEDGCRFIAHFTKHRVRTRDLNLISDTEFKLTEDESGRYTWTFGNVKQETKREILKMLNDGLSYNTIKESLDISKGYITKVRKKATEDGLLTSKGELTQSGLQYVSKG